MATDLPIPPTVAACKERTRNICIDIPETPLNAPPIPTCRWERQVVQYAANGSVITSKVVRTWSLSEQALLGKPGVQTLFGQIASKLDELTELLKAEEAAQAGA